MWNPAVRALLALVSISLPATTLAAVGRTETSFDVSDTGEATYSIPIFTPPGTNGMTPQLAFAYGHRNGNTRLGVGWDIAGLSVITRCPRTWVQDGVSANVWNHYADRFCLDGNKLRLVPNTGSYGAIGAEYRTEIESFARIRSYGAVGNGPTHFVMEGKDGLTYEYGNTPDSRIESLGQSTARAWALNRVSDRAGNSIVLTYFEDTTYGSYRIDLIEYTKRPEHGSASPPYAVDFVYESKPSNEIDSGYLAGSPIREVTRLDYVDVKYNSAIVRRYQLTYEGALSSTVRSRLTSITECGGAAGTDCLPATSFAYQNGAAGLSAQSSSGATIPSGPDVITHAIDVNGDGRDDLVYPSSATSGAGHWMVMLANPTGFAAPSNTNVVNNTHWGAIPIDYNADGKADLLVPYSGGTWWVMLGGSGGLGSPQNTGVAATAVGKNAAAADVDGDGLEDLVWMDHTNVAISWRRREWTGTFSSTVHLVGPLGSGYSLNGNLVQQFGTQSQRRLPDFNGDGRAELAYAYTHSWFDGESQQWNTQDYWQIGSMTWPILPFAGTMFPRFLDLDGDGMDDMVYLDSGVFCKRHGTGTSFTAPFCFASASGFTFSTFKAAPARLPSCLAIFSMDNIICRVRIPARKDIPECKRP
jgi:hypothetical protein